MEKESGKKTKSANRNQPASNQKATRKLNIKKPIKHHKIRNYIQK